MLACNWHQGCDCCHHHHNAQR